MIVMMEMLKSNEQCEHGRHVVCHTHNEAGRLFSISATRRRAPSIKEPPTPLPFGLSWFEIKHTYPPVV